MGKLFSKRKTDETYKNTKKKSWKHNPEKYGSTQSMNVISDSEISQNPRNFGSAPSLHFSGISHNPTGHRQYDQLEHTHNFSRYVDRPNQRIPAPPPRKSPPPMPMHPQEFPSPSYDDILVETDRFQTPPSLPPPLPDRSTENRRQSAPGETNPLLPPPIPPPPLSDRPAVNCRPRPSSPVLEDDEEYQTGRKAKGRVPPIESIKPDSDSDYDSLESDSKQRVRAERNYEANFDSDVSFRKGDILQLIKERETADWYFVRNLTTEKEGYVPKLCVTLITGNDVESQKYFFKKMNRQEAIERLSEPEVQTGTYLLRPRGVVTGDGYVLSLRCENELHEMEIRHYKIRFADKGICYLEADHSNKPFGSITELIQNYTDKPDLRCKLKWPLLKHATLKDLTVKFSELKLGEVLGSGNFGAVYAGTLHKNKQVAVKSLKEQGSMTVEEFQKEADTMHKLRHQNLVSLLGICEHRGKILIITERMSKGALLDLLRKDSGNAVKFKDLMQMAIQAVDGMCYLERKGFVHRDLRAANVLVGDGYITKIADFGLARLLDDYYGHQEFYQDKAGSVFPYKWTAPEAMKQLRFTVKSDVWSFGILLYEMVTYGDEPYAGMKNAEVLDWLEMGNRLKRPKENHCPATLYNIMILCWRIKCDDRPDFTGIKETLVELNTIA